MKSFPPQHHTDAEKIEFHRLYGAWATVTPSDGRDILGDFAGPWWIAGGWALDAFTGTRRAHDDIDVAIFRHDLPELQRAVTGRLHVWSASSGALRPVNDQYPDLLDDAVQVWLREEATAPWLLDVLLNPSRNGRWVNRRNPSMTAPLDAVTWTAPDGIRYLDPEIVLIFKAKHARPKDHEDLRRTWPAMTEPRRRTLRDHLRDHHPGHEWESCTR
ncbi:nucleotidyltransferase domain-containing protein [Nocardia miyunensis]|uniref:nucleotidyltransferase domain-containing protein n=1 Tax=Nocardia miyunensis TaxID=282684 RepID=UPI000A06CA0E|nr:hypothetical protein [Nocardia miyunensis]